VTTLAGAVVAMLEALGVRRTYVVTGGPIAPLCDALGHSAIRALHCRHESGAAFAALEDSLACGAPAAVLATTGPGITNALTGMCAARADGGKVLLVSASTSPREVGRHAFQETSPYTLPDAGLFRAGPIFHDAWRIHDGAALAEIAEACARGVARPQGWVGHLSVSIAAQTAPFAQAALAPERVDESRNVPSPDPALVETCARELPRGELALWLGFGARSAAAEVAELVARTGAAVMASPRAKGVFPEDHPRYLGVTGLGGHARVKEYLSSARPARVLVLGSRLGELTSFWDPAFAPGEGFIQVDVEPGAVRAAYPEARVLEVRAEVRAFLRALLERGTVRAPGAELAPPARVELAPRAKGPVRPALLLEAVQRAVVDATDAIVLTEAGNAFAWGSRLRFATPGRYRVSTGWGAMGHAGCGVLGAALGSGRPAVALLGDGAMLMQSELSTAVQYGVPAIYVVLNDGAYGMIEHGMRAQGFTPLETRLPATDFAALARALGAEGRVVERETELDAALQGIATRRAPLVVDVRVDPTERAPFGSRVQSLIQQTAHHPSEERA
jgi:acetolactate synthase-1/2/3 large subunit